MNPNQTTINQTAQGIQAPEDTVSWFESLDEPAMRGVLEDLDLCIYQSHPVAADIDEGIKMAGLKPTFTPCVIAKTKPFVVARQKVLGLPADELVKAFKLWLAIFTIEDTRRRNTQCKGGCSHDWHNLSNA